MSELKPCPFCGADAKIEDHGSFKIVGCSKLSMLCPNPRMAVYNNDFSWWNHRSTDNQLTTTTKQRDELQKYLRHIHDYMLVKNKSYREGDLSAEVGTLLSTIKEQKDAQYE